MRKLLKTEQPAARPQSLLIV